MFGSAIAPNVNVVAYSDLYLDANTPSLAQMASGAVSTSATQPGIDGAPMVYGMGHPLVWGAAIIVGFLFIGWLAHFLGRGEAFANTRVSAVTIIVSGASAALFIYVLKLVAVWTQQYSPNNGFAGFALGL